MCHLASVDREEVPVMNRLHKSLLGYMLLKKHYISRHCMHLNHDCLPADLVLSRVGSLSLWISPSPPWMSPARSWRIGEGHLQEERKGEQTVNYFLPAE